MVEVIDVNEIDDLVSSIWLLISMSLLTCFPCSQNPARAHQHLQTPSSTSSCQDQCSQLQLFYLIPSFLCKPHTLKASIQSSMLQNNVIWLVLYNLVLNSSDLGFRILQLTHQIPCPSSLIHLWLAHMQPAANHHWTAIRCQWITIGDWNTVRGGWTYCQTLTRVHCMSVRGCWWWGSTWFQCRR